jgi:hypothetical protein
MPWHADLIESKLPTGEPDAGDRPVRFGGRGKVSLCPYPYPARIQSKLRARLARLSRDFGEASPSPVEPTSTIGAKSLTRTRKSPTDRSV